MINNISQTSGLNAASALPMSFEQIARQLPTATSESSESNPQSLKDILSQLALLLNSVQTETSNDQAAYANMNKKISTDMIGMMQQQVQKIQDELNAKANESGWQKFIDWLTGAVGVIIAVVGVLTANPALAFIGASMAVIAFSNATGLTDKITAGISAILKKMGVDPLVADLIAQLIIAAVVFIATYGAGAGAECSLLKNVAQAGFALGSALLAAPRLMSDIATLVLLNDNSLSKEEKEKREQEVAMIQAIIGAIFAIVGGGISNWNSIAENANGISKFFGGSGKILAESETLAMKGTTYAEAWGSNAYNRLPESMKNIVNKANSLIDLTNDWGKSSETLKFAYQAGLKAFDAGTQSGNIAINATLADLTLEIAENNAGLDMSTAELKINDEISKAALKDFANKLKNQSAQMTALINAIEIEGSSYVNAIAG